MIVSAQLVSILVLCLFMMDSSSAVDLYHPELRLLKPPDLPAKEHDSSLFGFSLAYQKHTSEHRMIVSAPTGDDVGRVYYCPLSDELRNNVTECQYANISPSVHIDRSTIIEGQNQIYDHDLWLGATLAVLGENYVTCAPRWSKEVIASKDRKEYLAFGQCYLIDCTSTGVTSFQLNTTTNDYTGGYGWNSAVYEKQLFVGAPGVKRGGAVFSTETGERSVEQPVQILDNLKSYATTLGYAMVTGNFYNANDTYLATSNPYGEDGHGTVIFYDVFRKYVKNNYIIDPNVGSMFGASLCSADVNRDGIADLLVGAPLYTGGPPGDQYETGAVFVYLSERKRPYSKKLQLTGEAGKMRGSFGFSITNLGDLNSDGITEFAVGAPFEDEGKGAVYVFSGISSTYVQRISPSKSGVRGFGASIIALPDIDKNGCNEMAVGAIYSEEVVLLMCPTFIQVKIRTNIVAVIKEGISDVEVKQFDFESCVTVTYNKLFHLSELTGKLLVRTSIRGGGVSISHNDTEYTISLKKEEQTEVDYCRNLTALSPHPEGDDIEFIMSVTIDATEQAEYAASHAAMLPVAPLVLQIPYRRGCHDDGCNPELKLTVDSTIKDSPYEIGSGLKNDELVTFNLTITNYGDSAYYWCLRISTQGARISPSSKCEYVNDYQCNFNTNPDLHSKIAVYKGGSHSMAVYIAPLNNTNNNTIFSLKATLEQSCHQNSFEPVYKNYSLVVFKEKINLIKSATNDSIIYSLPTEVKNMSHVYWVKNEGPTRWVDQKIRILTPSLSYVNLSQPISQIIDSCQPTKVFNESALETICTLKDILPALSYNITVRMVVFLSKSGDALKKGNISISTSLNMTAIEKFQVSTSIVSAAAESAPLRWWHILLAVIGALLILCALAYGLYKTGFFQRRGKKRLIELKRQSVLRVSIRSIRTPRCSTIDAHATNPEHPDGLDNLDNKMST